MVQLPRIPQAWEDQSAGTPQETLPARPDLNAMSEGILGGWQPPGWSPESSGLAFLLHPQTIAQIDFGDRQGPHAVQAMAGQAAGNLAAGSAMGDGQRQVQAVGVKPGPIDPGNHARQEESLSALRDSSPAPAVESVTVTANRMTPQQAADFDRKRDQEIGAIVSGLHPKFNPGEAAKYLTGELSADPETASLEARLMQQFGMTRAKLDQIHKDAEEQVATQFMIKQGAETAVPESKLLGLGAMLSRSGAAAYKSIQRMLELEDAADTRDNVRELPGDVEKTYKQMLWKTYNDQGYMMQKPQIYNGQVWNPGSMP